MAEAALKQIKTDLHWHTRPDDLHVHLRDGAALELTVPHVSRQVARCIVMPNLVPPVTTTEEALTYRDRILKHIPEDRQDKFTPMMTLYLTDKTTADEIERAAANEHVYAVKLYPAGATTNSDAGVTDFKLLEPALTAMSAAGMPLLVHGEATDQSIDVFDREKEFIETTLKPLVAQFPDLKIVMEHITTESAVAFVQNAPENVAATITPQHLLYNRNAIFQGGVNPHKYCLPVLKRETHRKALIEAATSGSNKFFMGSDSAPHVRSKKEASCGCAGIYSAHATLELYAAAFESVGALPKLEAFACENGAKFYGLTQNAGETVMKREAWTVPDTYEYAGEELVPLKAGETLDWKLQ